MKVSVTPSMLSAAGRCLMQVYWFHIMKLRLRPGLAREHGRGIHKQLLDIDRKSFIETGKYRPIEELKEGFSVDLQHILPEISDSDEDIQRFGGPREALSHYEKSGLEIFDKYNEDRSVTEARDVEKEFEVECADTTMRGRFDLVMSDTQTGDIKTRDLSKKGARDRNEKELNDAQVQSYAFANARLTKEPNQCVDIIKVLTTKGEPIIRPVKLPIFTERSHEAIEEKAYRLHKIIKADAFFPVEKSSQNGWVCQEKYCGAWKAFNRDDDFEGCPFGERSQVSVAVS